MSPRTQDVADGQQEDEEVVKRQRKQTAIEAEMVAAAVGSEKKVGQGVDGAEPITAVIPTATAQHTSVLTAIPAAEPIPIATATAQPTGEPSAIPPA